MIKRLFLTIGAVALFALPSFSKAAETEPAFEIGATIALNGFEGLVVQQLDWSLVSLRTLASTGDAGSGDWNRLKGPLEKLSAGMPAQAAVWFARPDGSYFTVEKGLTDQTIKDRSYFPRLLAGEDVNGELVVSKSTGKKSAIVATPVMKNGKVIGALGISISAEALANLVDQTLHLPDKIVFYALDANGQTALHRNTKLMFEFPSEMGSPSLTSAVRTMLSEPAGTVRYEFEGKQKLAIFKRSKSTGWIFVLGVTK